MIKHISAKHLVSFLLIIFVAGFSRCTGVQPDKYANFIDSSSVVYGPYKVVKLPITKGVRILNPIQISSGPNGNMYAANQSGEVYILKDSDGDGVEDEAALFCNVQDAGLKSPAGFAYRGDTIYIGTSQEIRAYLDKDKDGRADTSWTFFNDIPHSQHPYEWTSGMNFGNDGWLYFALTTDSWNAGASPDPKGYRGAILKVSPDGKTAERLAIGIRSVYGTGFHQTGDLFFVDNEGGGNPKEELNLLVKGKFYGHNPKKYPDRDSTTDAVHVLSTEAAPSGIEFNTLDNDFGGTGGDLFVAYYGLAERWKRGGVGRVKIEKRPDGSYSFQEFPVADIPKLSDLGFGKDGSLYVSYHGLSDYWYNPIEEKTGGFYKIVYDPALKDQPLRKRQTADANLSSNSIEKGKQLFAKQACFACHATDGKTEMLGPSLNGIANTMSREEIVDDIMNPSKRIKASMVAMRVTKKNGQVLLGRVVNADGDNISLMLIGNQVVQIPKTEIASAAEERKSLMYENLVKNLSKEELDHLLDYIVSLK
ncbi:MAG TPA: PQQ-dependent sugar dehydrogenase [Chitinophagaceae bacterium]|nr:PQQ-dependent sugar dehydrogenase [Chitinophagaceae bacterium]